MLKRIVVMCAVVFVMGATITGCPIPASISIVGVWLVDYPDDDFSEIWEFFEDGTFEWEDTTTEDFGDGTFVQIGRQVTTSESYDNGEIEIEADIRISQDGNSFTGHLTEWTNDEVTFDADIEGTRQQNGI